MCLSIYSICKLWIHYEVTIKVLSVRQSKKHVRQEPQKFYENFKDVGMVKKVRRQGRDVVCLKSMETSQQIIIKSHSTQ